MDGSELGDVLAGRSHDLLVVPAPGLSAAADGTVTVFSSGVRWLRVRAMASESVKALDGVGLELRSPQAIVEQLSGGQRQGVAIARAMYFKTKLMILDEPTNNLSVKESQKILKFVQDLKAQGIASIFISHNLQHVYPVADRIIVLSHGAKIGDFRRQDTSVEELISLIVQG